MNEMPVGPVLRASAQSEFIISAMKEMNPELKVISKGSYYRVSAPGHCIVTREKIQQYSGQDFTLPEDLELNMVSFQGNLELDENHASWVASGEEKL